MATKATYKGSTNANKVPRHTTVRLTSRDRAAAAKVVEAGWATTTTGAIRYALRFVSEHIGGSK